MSEKATKITRVEITGLWNRYDLVWNLRPDVNILAGANGSGKSTILRILGEAMFVNHVGIEKEVIKKATGTIRVDFQNGGEIVLDALGRRRSSQYTLTDFSFDFISTFDINLRHYSAEIVGGKTSLDFDIEACQERYLKYQLELGRRMVAILKNRYDERSATEVVAKKNRFFEIVDSLFAETGKVVNQNEDEIEFILDNQRIQTWQLSAGEKQLLIILMIVLVQDNNPSILVLDEPEISLHIDWQKKLIGYIRELNPNCQVILATHSPAIIMEGWADCVFEVRDLITLDRNAVPQ